MKPSDLKPLLVPGAYVAGGSVVRELLGLPDGKDIDVFFTSSEAFYAVQGALEAGGWARRTGTTDSSGADDGDVVLVLQLVHLVHAQTIELIHNERWTEPDDFLAQFDIDVCRATFSTDLSRGRHLQPGDRFRWSYPESLLERRAVARPTWNAEKTRERVKKYRALGFTVTEEQPAPPSGPLEGLFP